MLRPVVGGQRRNEAHHPSASKASDKAGRETPAYILFLLI
jgi:hypothetical protein